MKKFLILLIVLTIAWVSPVVADVSFELSTSVIDTSYYSFSVEIDTVAASDSIQDLWLMYDTYNPPTTIRLTIGSPTIPDTFVASAIVTPNKKYYFQAIGVDSTGVYDTTAVDSITTLPSKLLAVGDQYYIFSQAPIYLTAYADTVLEFPNFEQILFYNNTLFGYGWNYKGNSSIFTKRNYHRLWFSDIALPSYIGPTNTIDLDFGDNITRTFILRGNLYIATKKSIWRYSGTPRVNAIKIKVVTEQGVPARKNWVKATEEYGYFVNLSGIYRFDGVRPIKVSLLVDRIIEKNYASRIVTVYQDRKLYVSFPDSNFTLVYNEDYESFIKLGFGMTAAHAPPDTNIIYFGHPIYKGRIYTYPSGLYYDKDGEAEAITYDCTYESGWMDLGGYEHFKSVTELFIPIRTLGDVLVQLYTDFENTPCDSVRTDNTGRYVYRMLFDNDCYGEFFKVKITASTDSSVLVKGYKVEYTLPGDEIK